MIQPAEYSIYLVPTPRGIITTEDPLPPYVQEPGVPLFFKKLHEDSVLDQGCPLVRRLDLASYSDALEAVTALKLRTKEGDLAKYLADDAAFPQGATKICAGSFEPPSPEPFIAFVFVFAHASRGRQGNGVVWFGHLEAKKFCTEQIQQIHQHYRLVIGAES
jgi:hypothetical protein